MFKMEKVRKEDTLKALTHDLCQSGLLVKACNHRDSGTVLKLLGDDPNIGSGGGFVTALDIAFINDDIKCFEPLIRMHFGCITLFTNTSGKSQAIKDLVVEILNDKSNYI